LVTTEWLGNPASPKRAASAEISRSAWAGELSRELARHALSGGSISAGGFGLRGKDTLGQGVEGRPDTELGRPIPLT
jgi:hypothetical protein